MPREGEPDVVAFRLAVRALILFSNSSTRLSDFFCLLRLGAVTTQLRFAFAHLLQGPSGLVGSGSQRTFSPRQASHALDRFGLLESSRRPPSCVLVPPP